MAIHEILENSDKTFGIDNKALYIQYIIQYIKTTTTICRTKSGNTIRKIRSEYVSDSVISKLNGDLCKIGVNLVPFSRLHFFAIVQALPFTPGGMMQNMLKQQCKK